MSATFKLITGLCDEMIDPALPKPDVAFTPLWGLQNWLAAAIAQEPTDAGITVDGTVDLTLRGPVTRWLGYAFGNPRILPSAAAQLLPMNPGDPNPFFQIVDAVEREGGTLSLGDNPLALATATNVTRKEWLQVPYGQAAYMTGGDLMGLGLFLEFATEAALDANVPTAWPDRTYAELIDPDDPESGTQAVAHTYNTYPGAAPVQLGDKWYKEASNGIRYLHASEWAPVTLVVDAPYTVITQDAYRAIAAAN